MLIVALSLAVVAVAIGAVVAGKLRAAVAERERTIVELMENIGQGVLRVTRDGAIMPPHSTILTTWFGAFRGGDTLWAMVRGRDPRVAAQLEGMWEANVRADVLPPEVALDQLAKRARIGDWTLAFSYRTVMPLGALDHILVVVSDVTAAVAEARAKAAASEKLQVFQWLLRDRLGVLEFFVEGEKHYDTVAADGDLPSGRPALDVLAAGAAVFGMHSLADVCHEVEDRLAEGVLQLTPRDRAELAEAWRGVNECRRLVAGDRAARAIEIDTQEHHALLSAIAQN